MTSVVRFPTRNPKVCSSNANTNSQQDSVSTFGAPINRGGVLFIPHVGALKGSHFSTNHMYPWGVWLWRSIWRREQFSEEIIWEYSLEPNKISYLTSASPASISADDMKALETARARLPIILPVQVAMVATIAKKYALSPSDTWIYIYAINAHVRQCHARGSLLMKDFPTSYTTINAHLENPQNTNVTHLFVANNCLKNITCKGFDRRTVHLNDADMVDIPRTMHGAKLFCAHASSDSAKYESRRQKLRFIEKALWSLSIIFVCATCVNIAQAVLRSLPTDPLPPKPLWGKNSKKFHTHYQTFKDTPTRKRFTHEF